jgi:HlyD family secretion protein
MARLRAEREALLSQLKHLNLLAFADGLVTARNAEPGSTVTAGQTVIEIIDSDSLWINARFDQNSAEGLSTGLPAEITLRSRQSQTLAGSVLWVEPKADAVTEEMLAKIVFATTPTPLPSIGELAQIRLQLPALAETPTVLNAAIRTLNGQRGVWKLTQDEILFVPVVFGRTDLDGYVQVLNGLQVGDQVVLYSDKTLKADSRFHITESLTGTSR